MRIIRSVLLIIWLAGGVLAEPVTLPLDQRPGWLERDGIVMAGSWEPLPFRVRRDGSDGYEPTAEQVAAYQREHSPEMIAQLKELGVNFVMMHCYKGAGLEAERESMADAVRFSRLCHEAGLRVGVYNYSGAFIWELFFKEMPQAKNWVVTNADGIPHKYSRTTYRYFWNRNHPDAQAFYRHLVRFAIEDIQTDLLHFDNYNVGPGHDPFSVGQFREYLRDNFSADQLKKAGINDLETIHPPAQDDSRFLHCAWSDFSCQSLAASYRDMARYARTLRPDILVECNPGGVRNRIVPPVDHGQLLAGGEAFWDEGRPSGYQDGRIHSRIRTYKVARKMNNMAFAYATTPLEMAESMAFNRDCLGCVCWFEYGRVVARPGSKEAVSSDLPPFIRFFHKRRELFCGTTVVADVAILRSFSSQVFADSKRAHFTSQVEQKLIENRVPFQIIYDGHLAHLAHYRCLVLAGCVALSDKQIAQIRHYVSSGGRLCVIGPVATHDEWMMPRTDDRFADLSADSVTRLADNEDYLAGIRRCCGGQFALSIEAHQGLCAELMDQPHRRLVHLVNYRVDTPARNIRITMAVPAGREVTKVRLVSPPSLEDKNLSFKRSSHNVTFTVPLCQTYGISIADLNR